MASRRRAPSYAANQHDVLLGSRPGVELRRRPAPVHRHADLDHQPLRRTADRSRDPLQELRLSSVELRQRRQAVLQPRRTLRLAVGNALAAPADRRDAERRHARERPQPAGDRHLPQPARLVPRQRLLLAQPDRRLRLPDQGLGNRSDPIGDDQHHRRAGADRHLDVHRRTAALATVVPATDEVSIGRIGSVLAATAWGGRLTTGRLPLTVSKGEDGLPLSVFRRDRPIGWTLVRQSERLNQRLRRVAVQSKLCLDVQLFWRQRVRGLASGGVTG